MQESTLDPFYTLVEKIRRKTRITELRTEKLEQKRQQKLLKEQMPVIDTVVFTQVNDLNYKGVTVYNTQNLDTAIRNVAKNIVFDAQKITIAPANIHCSNNQTCQVYEITVKYPNMDEVDFCKLQNTTFHDLYKGFIHNGKDPILSTYTNERTICIYAPLKDILHLQSNGITRNDEPISANTVSDYVASKLKQLLEEYQKRQR